MGYPGMAAFMAGDADRFVVRRFDLLHVRVILTRQAELQLLQGKLDALDFEWRFQSTDKYNNGTVHGEHPKREKLLREIRTKLEEFDSFVIQYWKMCSLPNAPERSSLNVRNWLKNNFRCIDEDEAMFANETDLIAVRATTRSALRHLCDPWITRLSRSYLPWLRKAASRGDDDAGSVNQATIYASDDDAVDRMATVLTFAAGLGLLITPLWVLQAGSGDTYWRLGVVTSFLVVFMSMLSFATTGTPHQIIAATAGYAAVLVVFLQPL